MSISFSVRGRPVTQGSKVASVNRHTGFAVMREVNGQSLQAWRLAISAAAREAMGDRPLMTGPVKIEATFWLRRPASAPKTKRTWPIGTRSGDADKYLRALGDSLSQVVFLDDSQVVDVRVIKDFAVPPIPGPGVDVVVEEITT